MPNILCRKTPSGFFPADQVQYEELEEAKVPNGELVAVSFKMHRNYKFLQKFFVMLRHTFDMQDEIKTLKQWRAVVTAGAGHCDWVKGRNDQLVAIPKSISYNSMPDEAEFRQVYQDALTYICENYVDDDPEHLNTIIEFM